MDQNVRTPTTMNNYRFSDFDSSDFLDFGDERVDIFIQNDNIFVMTAPKKIHEITSMKIYGIIESETRYRIYEFESNGTSVIKLFNYLNCCPKFIKQPDLLLIFTPAEKEKMHLLLAKSQDHMKILNYF